MRKLLDREPTEEMLEAVYDAHERIDKCDSGSNEQHAEIYQAMFDAAPEVKVDMEPVAYGTLPDHVFETEHTDAVFRAYNNAFYSAEQLATLQAENERLRKEREHWGKGLSNITAERDELLAICREFVRRVECGEVRSKRTYAAMIEALAKHEGEKHD